VVEEEPEPAHQAVRGPGHVARELPVQADPVRAPVHLIITPDNRHVRPGVLVGQWIQTFKYSLFQKKIINNVSTSET
jgi:hypothetical protein